MSVAPPAARPPWDFMSPTRPGGGEFGCCWPRCRCSGRCPPVTGNLFWCCPACWPPMTRRGRCGASCAAWATGCTAGGSGATSARRPRRWTDAGPPACFAHAIPHSGQRDRLEPRRHLRGTLARRTPAAVRQVITLGSPFRLAHERQSRASRIFNRYTHLHVARAPLPLEHDVDVLPVPATSIYSRFDGIVAWQACLDPPSPRSENIAVVGSHFGYGHNPAAVLAVADRLAQPLGAWRRSSRRGRCGRCFPERTCPPRGSR